MTERISSLVGILWWLLYKRCVAVVVHGLIYLWCLLSHLFWTFSPSSDSPALINPQLLRINHTLLNLLFLNFFEEVIQGLHLWKLYLMLYLFLLLNISQLIRLPRTRRLSTLFPALKHPPEVLLIRINNLPVT